MMSGLDLGPKFGELAGLVARDAGSKKRRTLFYARAEPGVIGSGLYQDRGDHIEYAFGSDIDETAYELWEVEAEADRWTWLFIVVEGKRFEAKLLYPDQLDPDEDEENLCNRMVKELLGDKPIIYPDEPNDYWPEEED